MSSSEIWADCSNNKQLMCSHFPYLSHGICSFIILDAVNSLRTISPGCFDEKCYPPLLSMYNSWLLLSAFCQPVLTFIFRTLTTAKGTFWDLLKYIKVKKCHVHELLVRCQFFNKMFSRIPAGRKADACWEAPFH